MSTHMWLRSIAYRLGQVRQQLGFVTSLTGEDYKEVARALPSSAALSLFCTMSPADQQHALRVCRGLQARGSTDEDMLAAALLHDVGKAQGRVPFWTRSAIVLGKKLAPQLLSRLVIYPDREAPPQSVGAGEDEEWRGDPCGRPHPLSRGRPQGSPPRTTLPPPLRNEATSKGRAQKTTLVKEEEETPASSTSGEREPVFNGHHLPTIPKWRQSLSNAWYHAEIGADLAYAAGLSGRAVLYIRTHHQPGGPAAELHEVDEVS